jgi:aminoglycoside phosphotransferase (APT) family kinase protein
MAQEKSSNDAVAAAVTTARGLGLRVDEPVVLHDSSNLLVHLKPAPVVARVATTTAVVRQGSEWLAREVAVARHLTRAGAPVVAPSAEVDPGPHTHEGLSMSFWELVEPLPEPADPRAAGQALRECHEALEDFDDELPPFALVKEAGVLLDLLTAERSVTAEGAAKIRDRERQIMRRLGAIEPEAMRAVHGDAHLGNVINTERGPLWSDWEDTNSGPLEWDLACLIARARWVLEQDERVSAALAGYDTTGLNRRRLALLIELRVLQVAVWGVLIAKRNPQARPRIERMLRAVGLTALGWGCR